MSNPQINKGYRLKNSKRDIVLILILFLGIGVWSCDEEDDIIKTNDSINIIGSWLKTDVGSDRDSLIITFKENGIVEYYAPEGITDELFFSGLYDLRDDNTIVLTDEGCLFDETEEFIEGRYRLEQDGETLEFILVEDECDRADFLTGLATKTELRISL
ncbi:MAG: hypothetical protein Kapaf2KO_18910 [Candidatus Kapaibacteriales bacterium]